LIEMQKSIIKTYWEKRLPQRWYSNKKPGTKEYYDEITFKRYNEHFPYLEEVAEFNKHAGEKVLEVGVGIGTDLLQYAKYGSICYGIDLTETAIKITKKRFKMYGLKAQLQVADCENLPFDNNFFDLVYSMGVLHHTNDTQKGVNEVYRVLKPGGKAIIWLYGKDWWYYFFVPIYHGLLQGELFKMPYRKMINKHKEIEGNCPIARHYTPKEAIAMFTKFRKADLYKHRGPATLGNRFLVLNRAFCKIMNKLFPGGGMTIKAIK